jgi:hypothetical protein
MAEFALQEENGQKQSVVAVDLPAISPAVHVPASQGQRGPASKRCAESTDNIELTQAVSFS